MPDVLVALHHDCRFLPDIQLLYTRNHPRFPEQIHVPQALQYSSVQHDARHKWTQGHWEGFREGRPPFGEGGGRTQNNDEKGEEGFQGGFKVGFKLFIERGGEGREGGFKGGSKRGFTPFVKEGGIQKGS